jgi:excisionase family DNA binding protein
MCNNGKQRQMRKEFKTMGETSTNRTRRQASHSDRLLSYDQVADRLGTTRRFPKRLAEERRIESVKVGRERKIRESALERWIADNTTQALP